MEKVNHTEGTNNFKTLIIDNVKYRTRLTDKFQNRKNFKRTDPKKVITCLPGVIKKINVDVGSKVKVNDKLLVMEAMKMNNYILSPLEGTIKKINVKAGDIVPKSCILLEFK